MKRITKTGGSGFLFLTFCLSPTDFFCFPRPSSANTTPASTWVRLRCCRFPPHFFSFSHVLNSCLASVQGRQPD